LFSNQRDNYLFFIQKNIAKLCTVEFLIDLAKF